MTTLLSPPAHTPGIEALTDARMAGLPAQVTRTDREAIDVAGLPDHTIHYSLPVGMAFVCTAEGEGITGSIDSGRDGTCRGQVLQVAVKRPDQHTWAETHHGVCQNRNHRQRMVAMLKQDATLNISSQSVSLAGDRFPPVDPTLAVPEVASVTTTSVELPGHSDLQRRVLAYLLGYDGSVDTRHQAFLYLAERDTFYPGLGDQAVTEHLQMLVEENPMGACSDGLQRFRDALDLPSTLQNWRATLVSHGATVGHIDFTVATTDEDEARRHVDNHVRLSYIDRALSAALDEFDADGFSYSGDFDVLLDEVELMGPAD